MVKTRGGSSSRTRKEGSQNPNIVGMTSDGQPIPLQEPNPEHGEQFQFEPSGTNEGMGVHVPPTSDDSGKNPIPDSNSAEKVASTEILVSPIGGEHKGRNVDSQQVGVEKGVGDVNPSPRVLRVSNQVSKTLWLRQAISLQRLIALLTLQWLKS
ncbi:hypothetical protein LIER_29669 [Lithospermum erythrorhizon]|uniref:Uncharacterized protein n=1 Tax=Lithospermum erythrorhizon TaxID=34254 RepID=A0AAV3RJZ6_LITER